METVTPFLTLVLGAFLGYFFRRRGDEHQIRYTRLYEQRAEVIARLYELSFEVSQALFEWTSPFGYSEGPTKEELGNQAITRVNELVAYHQTNAIWLDAEENGKVEAFVAEARRIVNDFLDFRDMGGFNEPGGPRWSELGEGRSRPKVWTEIHRRTRNELRGLREDLGFEFRQILAVSEASQREAPLPRWRRLLNG